MNGNYAMSVFAGETEQETETAKPEEDKKPEEWKTRRKQMMPTSS